MRLKGKPIAIIEHLLEKTGSTDNTCKANFLTSSVSFGFPGKFWNDETIRMSIEAFITEYSRLPTAKEMDDCPYLPSHIVIIRHYQKNPTQWMTEQFPGVKMHPSVARRVNRNKMTPAELGEVFVSEFKRINPTSSYMYNLERDPSTPSWEYIAKCNGLDRWTQLKDFFHVSFQKETKKFIVVHHVGRKGQRELKIDQCV